MTEKFLTGQVALVSGGSTGIGAACAIELARRGADVGVNYHSSDEEAESVAEKCREFGQRAITIKGDVSTEEGVKDVFDTLCTTFGVVDILVANAGIQKDADFLKMSADEWSAVIGVDLTGQFLCAQAAARRFVEQGDRRGGDRAIGKIVHMSSVHDRIPWAGHVNYAAAKGGIAMMAKSIAQELAPKKIRVNLVSPGAVKTEINRDVWDDEEKAAELRKLIPYDRIGEPEDIARTVAWLLSDDADYITGATLYVDGGMTLYPGFSDNG